MSAIIILTKTNNKIKIMMVKNHKTGLLNILGGKTANPLDIINKFAYVFQDASEAKESFNNDHFEFQHDHSNGLSTMVYCFRAKTKFNTNTQLLDVNSLTNFTSAFDCKMKRLLKNNLFMNTINRAKLECFPDIKF